MITAMFISTNIQTVSAMQNQPSVSLVLDNHGFVEVQLQDLSETVQAAISNYTQDYDIKALKYNAEKQLTKVKLTKKDDQSIKTVYLDAEGKEVEAPAKKKEKEQEAVEKEILSN